MSSFYAELTVGGQSPYPLRQCQFEFTQATDQRGRAAAKVRHGLLHLTLDVPTDDQLLDWANTVHKTLAGHVTFFEDDRRTARETVRFAAGQCVSYQESFVAGDAEVGAYVCQLIITSDGLSLAPGGPAPAFVAPAARDYAAPIIAKTDIPRPPVNEVITTAEATRSAIDLMRFSREKRPLEEKLQSPKTGYLGSPRMSRKELAKLSTELKTIGVQLIIDKKGVLPSFARAGFNPINGKLYLRKGATHFEAFHETQHAKQWAELGISQYNKQSRLEREKYVFDKIVDHKNLFSDSEITAANNYINSLM